MRTLHGFTLVELLVVIGIIGVLVSILMPTLAGVRAQARVTECASNLRQIATSLMLYANDHRGSFPPNVSSPNPGRFWYHVDRLGPYLRSGVSYATPDARGRVITCPDDDDAVRSYAMNVWASSEIDSGIRNSGTGTLWKQGVRNASQMILVTEKFAGSGNAKFGWMTTPHVGVGPTPGRRFGGGGGISPLINTSRFGPLNCELAFYRHRPRGINAPTTEARGRINIAYADGHVALKSEFQLVDAATGLSTLDSWWSPLDAELNRE